MKVVKPTDTTHNVTLIPRFNTLNPLTLLLYNETTKEETTVINTHVIVDGNLTITFDFAFVEKDRFQIKISDGTLVVYRGKLIATEQVTQEFTLSEGLYFFPT